MQAWSPIGRQRVLTEGLVQELAEKYGVSPARICLKFAVQGEESFPCQNLLQLER